MALFLFVVTSRVNIQPPAIFSSIFFQEFVYFFNRKNTSDKKVYIMILINLHTARYLRFYVRTMENDAKIVFFCSFGFLVRFFFFTYYMVMWRHFIAFFPADNSTETVFGKQSTQNKRNIRQFSAMVMVNVIFNWMNRCNLCNCRLL